MHSQTDSQKLSSQKVMRVVFDLSELIDFVRDHAALSGIQRVQLDVYKELIRRDDIEVVAVHFSELSKRYFPIEQDRLLQLDKQNAASIRPLAPSRISKLLRRVRRLWSFRIRTNDLVFVAGASWVSRRRTNYLSDLQRTLPIRIAWMFYDLIPISHPEYTSIGNIRDYQIWIDKALALPSLFLCISEFSRKQLSAYASSKGQAALTVTVPLAHEFSTNRAEMRHDFIQSANQRFVLCVGTLDNRKNQLALVRIWQRLFDAMGNKLPFLILVGAKGWLADGLSNYLEVTGHVHGRVIHLADASDMELAWLYQSCEFTVFPSLVEGWGLPVGESLWFGKPCICFRHSAIPEVGNGNVIYCTANDNAQLEETIFQAIAGKFAAYPPERSKLRTWHMVAHEIVAALISYQQGAATDAAT